ncbi:MAG: hypothetical protein QM704_03525 [Anaeromyxobacteraceae bacterium]
MSARPEVHLLAALLAAAPGSARGGGLVVTVEPARLLLGQGDTALVRVTAEPGAPPPAEVALAASVGAVEDVQRTAAGFTARYRPPAGPSSPAVAIVAAVSWADGRDGAVALPLDGQGVALVRGEPGEPVELRIGERLFGPVVAGADGVARLRVVVPPGVAEGYRGFRPVELAVPPAPRMLALADRTAVAADRAERVRVLAWVVAPHGATRRGEAPVATPSRGAAEVVAREPGAYQVSWAIPPGPAGEDRLVLAVANAPPWELRVRSEGGLAPVAAARGPAPGPGAPGSTDVPGPVTAALVSGGASVDLGGGFAAPRIGVSVDGAPVPGLPALAWRLDAELLGAPPAGVGAGVRGTTLAALGGGALVGVSATRGLGDGWLAFASATAGVRLAAVRSPAGDDRLAPGPALRLAAGTGMRFAWGTPFVEAGLSATGGAMAGGRLALVVAVGFRGEGRP